MVEEKYGPGRGAVPNASNKTPALSSNTVSNITVAANDPSKLLLLFPGETAVPGSSPGNPTKIIL